MGRNMKGFVSAAMLGAATLGQSTPVPAAEQENQQLASIIPPHFGSLHPPAIHNDDAVPPHAGKQRLSHTIATAYLHLELLEAYGIAVVRNDRVIDSYISPAYTLMLQPSAALVSLDGATMANVRDIEGTHLHITKPDGQTVLLREFYKLLNLNTDTTLIVNDPCGGLMKDTGSADLINQCRGRIETLERELRQRREPGMGAHLTAHHLAATHQRGRT